MAKPKRSGGTVKNRHGNVDIPVIERSLLGTKEFPLTVYRGSKDESGVWIARIASLPGYLGWGDTEAHAIARLWHEIGDGPVYDVGKMHRTKPTSANIRYVLGQAQRAEDARAEAGANSNSAFRAAVAKNYHVTRNSADAATATNAMWQSIGGIDAF